MARTQKGKVAVKESHGRLQLVFRYRGKRFYLSTGLPDTPLSRAAIVGRVAEIEKDLAYDALDVSLAKYRPQAITPDLPPNEGSGLIALWDAYVKFKSPQVSAITIAKDFVNVRHHLECLPPSVAGDAVAIRDYWLGRLSPARVKRLLMQINSCHEWAVKAGLVDANSFKGSGAEIKVSKSRRQAIDTRAFTAGERDAIIQAFAESPVYAYLTHVVKFAFFTGARPGEFLALEWGDIHHNTITISRALTLSMDGRMVKDGLKTQPRREFPVNPQLQAILDAVPRQGKLLFPGKGGGYLDWSGFTNRAWRGKILPPLVASGQVKQYLRPYAMRHSFITLALQAGMDVATVGKLVGNSPQVIYAHYSAARRDIAIPAL